MLFCLNRPYLGALDLKNRVPSEEFRCGAIGAGRVTQKHGKCMEIEENAKYRKSQTMKNDVFRSE